MLNLLCTRCDCYKDFSCFSPEKNISRGYKYVCKECKAEQRIEKLEYLAKNPVIWPLETKKYCSNCVTYKTLDMFHEHNLGSYGRQTFCIDCRAEKHKNKGVYSSHGLTSLQFFGLLNDQNNKCAICDEITQKSLVVDHDHSCCLSSTYSCGKCIRGLLCGTCNSLLGQVRDSVFILNKMINYLSNNLNYSINRTRVFPKFNSTFYYPDIPFPKNGIGIKTDTHKVCSICRENKLHIEFGYKNNGLLHSYCLICSKEHKTRQWLESKYCITLEEYNFLLMKQRGCCAICDEPQGGKSLSVDHCHKTDVIRGLLCYHCNLGLGHAKDKKETLINAITYLV